MANERNLVLDGRTLTRADVCAVARGGVHVTLDPAQLDHVQRCADFLASQVSRGEPIYGVTTGFGSNADKLLGAHRARDELPGGNPESRSGTLVEELQHNLVITHAVCVGEPFGADVVRAMLVIRINTLMRGHSGIRASTLQALVALLNRDVVPIIPRKGSVGASGDLAPLSHLAIVLLGGGEAWYGGERMPGGAALARAGLSPVALSFKEGLALNNGTTQMLACAVLALARVDELLALADLAAAMTLDAFAGRSSAFRPEVHALRPHPGQVETAANLRRLLEGSTLVDIPYHLVPRFRTWLAGAWHTKQDQAHRFDIAWDYVPPSQRHGRESFYARFLPFKGGKKHQPQDSYSLRCIPQVHGAVRDALAQAQRVVDIELNAVTDNPLVFSEDGKALSGGFVPVALIETGAAADPEAVADPGASVDITQLSGQSGRVLSLAVSSDGLRVLAGCSGGVAYLWDRRAERPVRELAPPGPRARTLAVSADGRVVASCDGLSSVAVIQRAGLESDPTRRASSSPSRRLPRKLRGAWGT